MKPPICAVCGDRFDPPDGELVRFRPTDRGRAFAERQREDGVVGHPPDADWFCGRHSDAAIGLRDVATRSEALGTLTGSTTVVEQISETASGEGTSGVDVDLGNGRRVVAPDGDLVIEWPLDWIEAADVRARFAGLVPEIARSFGGSAVVDLAEYRSREPASVSGAGPEDDPFLDIVEMVSESTSPKGVTDVELRHRQRHLRADAVVEVSVELTVSVTTPDSRVRSMRLVAWGVGSDDLCNLMRLSGAVSGPVLANIREGFALGTDRWTQREVGGEPICLSCGEVFRRDTGGQAIFRVDTAGHDWNARRARGEEVGERPYSGWFCSRHIGPANAVADRLTRSEAMALLVPAGRAPLEYREHPDGIEVRVDEFGEPSRAPFVPVDDEWTPTWERREPIGDRTRREVHAVFHAALDDFGNGLGADRFRSFGTNGRFASAQSGELTAFVTRSDPAGLIVQRRERTVLEITAESGVPPRGAPDGEPLLERIVVRAASAETGRSIAPTLSGVLAELRREVADPFDRSPDLVDVDLVGGEVRRGLRSARGSVHWDLDRIDLVDIVATLSDLMAPLAALLGVDELPAMEHETTRTFTPMDGAVEPDCPYTDTTERTASVGTEDGVLRIGITEVRTHWNEMDVANVSASLSLDCGDRSIRIGASGVGDVCTKLSLTRPVVGGVVPLVAVAFGLRNAS